MTARATRGRGPETPATRAGDGVPAWTWGRGQLARAAAALALVGPPATVAQEHCAPHIEVNEAWQSASFRAHADDFRECPVDEGTYERVVRDWLAARPASAAPVESLFLGRAIRYPWISRHIATVALTDRRWDTGAGRAREAHENAVVGAIVLQPALRSRLQAPFADSALAVRGASVEKVLVGRLGDVLEGYAGRNERVPFDAQVWLVLERGDAR